MKQTVTGKYEPKSKNVTWIDMSSGSPVLKNFINGMWRHTGGSGGGGAGSPNPTEADATKVWQVTPVLKETKTGETVIVPEQTLVDGKILEYNDKFVPCAQCVAVIDGVEYRGEVFEDSGRYYVFEAEFGYFEYDTSGEIFVLGLKELSEATVKLSVIEETPIYDYNWAPGVKIPIPTAEDEGKILVVTKTEGNISIIVPEQSVPVDSNTPLTDVDLTKFVVGNTVKVTVSANSGTFTATGVIEDDGGAIVAFVFDFDGSEIEVWRTDNSLYTNANVPGVTIKLEYIEPNYEYQLQENSGGSGSTSNVLWPAMYEYNDNEIMATFVPEDVEPNTWCMVCGAINGASINTCLPVLITSYGDYVILNETDSHIKIFQYTIAGGNLLVLVYSDK